MLSEADLIQAITEKAKINYADLNKLIEEKELEFSGLVSRQGAILIVAKELGIDMVQHMDKGLKIENITAGMQKVNFFGKIVTIYPVKEFENKKNAGEIGKVVNLVLGDETGTIRLSLWNEQTAVIDKIKAGDILEVINGFSKTDYKGQPEIRLSKYGNLRKVNDMQIEVKKIKASSNRGNYQPATLDKIQAGQYIHLKAQLVQVYDRKLIYYMCPECRKKVMGVNCEKHGEITPSKLLILAGVIDDGTSTCPVSFFNESAEVIIGKTTDQIEKAIMYGGEKSFFSSIDVLGAFLHVKGVVKQNEVTGDKEISAQQVKPVDAIAEINSFLHEFGEKTQV